MPCLPWLRKLTPSLLAVGATSVLALLAGIQLARMLDPADLGHYTLLISIAGTIALVGTLGQPMLTRRLYALAPAGTYAWRRDLTNSILFAAPLLVILWLGLSLLYRFTLVQTAMLAVLTLFTVLLLFLDQILIAAQQYALGNTMQRLPNALILLPIALLILVNQDLNFSGAVAWRLLAALATVVLGIGWLARGEKIGNAQIEWAVRRQGYNYLLLAVTTLLAGEGVIVLAGFVIPVGELGAFAALSLFMRPWHIVTLVVLQIGSVEAAKRDRPWDPRAWMLLLLAATIGALLCAMAFPTLISWLYERRYDQYSTLGWPLMVTGAILLVEAPPRASMIARALPELVRHFSWTQALLAGVGAFAILFAGHRFGIEALAWVLCAYAGVRCITTVGFATVQLPSRSVPAKDAKSTTSIQSATPDQQEVC